jgi:hypothetical protein
MTAQTIRVAILTLALSASAATAVAQQRHSDQTAYTLYRNSPMFKDKPDMSQRIYIASFDAANEEEFNRTNCETAAELLTEHNSAPFAPRFWCERGRFRQ